MFYQIPTVVSDIGKYLEDLPIGNPWKGVQDINVLVPNLINLFLLIAVLVFLGMLLWGGIHWATAGGDKEKMTKAQGKVTAAIIGIIITFSAWAILGLVKDFFGINRERRTGSTNFSSEYVCSALNGKRCRPGTLSPGPCNYPGEGNCCICRSSGLWETTTVNASLCHVNPGDCQ